VDSSVGRKKLHSTGQGWLDSTISGFIQLPPQRFLGGARILKKLVDYTFTCGALMEVANTSHRLWNSPGDDLVLI